MISYNEGQYITNGDMSANVTGAWIHCTAIDAIQFHLVMGAVAATDGYFTVEGTDDPALSNGISLQQLYVSTSAENRFLAFPSSGTVVPEWIRLTYTRTAGGAANQLQVWVIGRG